MDPIATAVIAALAAVSKDVIGDSYNALKSALKKKFGADSDLVDAVDGLEKKPDSKPRQDIVKEEVELAKANEDPELVQLAQALMECLKEQPGGEQIIEQTIGSATQSAISATGDASVNISGSPPDRG